MIQRYRVLGRVVPEGERLQPLLAEAYARKLPVLCECRPGSELPLYIAHRNERYVLARWPGSGARHATACDHYEAPDHLTGMGQVRGSAVIDDEESGETSLRLGFPLSRGAARLAPAALTNDKPTVKSSGQKLTMRGLLHVLWDRAELTHWHPKMAGKRSWFVVRRALIEAANSCKAKQEALPHMLFVPETFRLEDKEDIRARRRAALERVYRSPGDMMVVIGEIKEFVPAHGAERIVLRHVGDKRRFVKGLRVNLDADAPIASLVLKDTGEQATAIHIHDRDHEAGEPLDALLASEGVTHVFWKEGEALPQCAGRPRRSPTPRQEQAFA